MPEPTYTEADLRDAFAQLALDGGADPDVTDLRERLGTALADGPTPALFELTPPATARRARRTRPVLAALIAAACVALVAAAAGIVGMVRHSGTPAARVPAVVRALYLPGERFVAEYSGTGPATITLPTRTLPKDYSWNAYWQCTGKASRFGVNDVYSMGRTTCATDAVSGSTFVPDHGAIHVQLVGTAAWHVWVSLAPDIRTNANLVPTAESQLATIRSGVPDYFTGSGNRTLHVTVSARPVDVVVTLTCHGDGVTIPGVTADRITSGGLYTHTCLAGRAYEWTGTRLSRSTTLQVHASSGTTWRIVVDG